LTSKEDTVSFSTSSEVFTGQLHHITEEIFKGSVDGVKDVCSEEYPND